MFCILPLQTHPYRPHIEKIMEPSNSLAALQSCSGPILCRTASYVSGGLQNVLACFGPAGLATGLEAQAREPLPAQSPASAHDRELVVANDFVTSALKPTDVT